jgi:hypothetical protein
MVAILLRQDHPGHQNGTGLEPAPVDPVLHGRRLAYPPEGAKRRLGDGCLGPACRPCCIAGGDGSSLRGGGAGLEEGGGETLTAGLAANPAVRMRKGLNQRPPRHYRHHARLRSYSPVAVLGRFRVERGANGEASSVMAVAARAKLRTLPAVRRMGFEKTEGLLGRGGSVHWLAGKIRA